MARDHRQGYLFAIVAHPCVPVAATDTRRSDLHDDAILRQFRISHGYELQRPLIAGNQRCAHATPPGCRTDPASSAGTDVVFRSREIIPLFNPNIPIPLRTRQDGAVTAALY
jgi:hypothetical protein